MIHPTRRLLLFSAALLALGAVVGMVLRDWAATSRAEPPGTSTLSPQARADRLAPESAAAYDPHWDKPYLQYQPVGKTLKPYPVIKPGEICPQDLSVYGGAGRTSYASVDDVGNFDDFYRRCSENKPQVMAERRKYMAQRYDLTGAAHKSATMTRGKPVPAGPVVRLPDGVKSWEELAALGPNAVRERGLFPLGFRPLSHPNQPIGHQLFPQNWVQAHPE